MTLYTNATLAPLPAHITAVCDCPGEPKGHGATHRTREWNTDGHERVAFLCRTQAAAFASLYRLGPVGVGRRW